jgi:CBS domain containing-hemolysin-like protein
VTVLAASFGGADVTAAAVVVLLLLVAALLVMAEAALGRMSVVRAEALAEEHPSPGRRLARLLADPERWVNVLRLVVVSAQLGETAVVALWADRWLDGPALVGAVVVNVVVVFVLGEAVPRTLGILHPDGVALVAAGPVGALARFPLFRLLTRVLIGITNIVVPGRGLRQGPFASAQELLALADAAVEDEVIEQDERDLIESVIEFSGTVVREVMVPRTDMVTVPSDMRVADALEVTALNGYSRVPAVGESMDDVLGLVYVKDLIRAQLDGKSEDPVTGLLRPGTFVPESKRVSELLKDMQRQSFHMAVVVDEYGGTAGLVTMEDLIEELVGDIVDEYDVEEPLIEELVDGSLLVDARILIDELNDLADLELPAGDWDTVGGLVLDRFGGVPADGEVVDVDGYDLRVERVQGRRVIRVRVIPRPQPAERVEEPAQHD